MDKFPFSIFGKRFMAIPTVPTSGRTLTDMILSINPVKVCSHVLYSCSVLQSRHTSVNVNPQILLSQVVVASHTLYKSAQLCTRYLSNRTHYKNVPGKL